MAFPSDQPVSEQVQAMLAGLAKAGVKNDCPCCEQPVAWTVCPDPMVVTAAHQQGRGFAALGLVCPVCGFVRLHSAAALDRYMDPRAH